MLRELLVEVKCQHIRSGENVCADIFGKQGHHQPDKLVVWNESLDDIQYMFLEQFHLSFWTPWR